MFDPQYRESRRLLRSFIAAAKARTAYYARAFWTSTATAVPIGLTGGLGWLGRKHDCIRWACDQVPVAGIQMHLPVTCLTPNQVVRHLNEHRNAVMQRIGDLLNLPHREFPSRLGELNGLLENVRSQVTWWGGRVVTIRGESGSIPLWRIADGIVDVVSEYKDRELNISNTKAAFEKVMQFYQQTDVELASKLFWTRILAYVWDHLPTEYSVRKVIRFFYEHNVI